MPASTLSRSSRRVIWRKRSRSSVSRWTLMRRSPASYSGSASSASSTPLVVSARSWMPGIAARRRISTGRSRRTSGSPPVTRSLRMPSVDGDADEALDLFEIQDLAARSTKCTSVLRHAVEAADVAAVGDADAQVVVNAAEGIDERRGRAFTSRRACARAEAAARAHEVVATAPRAAPGRAGSRAASPAC